jgi:hypothetical protein
MRFTKIKFDGDKVRIEYEMPRKDGGDPDAYTLLSIDKPLPEFQVALQAMKQDVIDICELDPSCGDKLTVRGVTLTHTNDVLGACVTALKLLKTANAPLVLNTPHLPEASYSGDDNGTPIMATAMGDRLSALMIEAERYVNGERAQASLFNAEDEAAFKAADVTVTVLPNK